MFSQLVSLHCVKYGKAPPFIEVKLNALETTLTEETSLTDETSLTREENALTNHDCEEEQEISEPDPNVLILMKKMFYQYFWEIFRMVFVIGGVDLHILKRENVTNFLLIELTRKQPGNVAMSIRMES